jgi:hypothetical protein
MRFSTLAIGLLSIGISSIIQADEIRFSTQIRPILAEYCLHCHGHDEQQLQGDLRLDTREGAIRHAIQPGAPDQSELIARVASDDDSLRMPPAETGKRLSAEQIAVLRQWIDQGAPYEEHWSFRRIEPHTPPATLTPVATEIDRFVVARLEQSGMQLSPPVDKRTWIRRATYDLHGLPPTSEEIDAFIGDDSTTAYETVLDRLLDSPRYGQRWGRYWLDIARYADTHGGAAIGFTKFPFSYTYRDYVIDAMNRDVPYDRFIHEQLAADQLGLADNDPALAGLGFLTVGMQYRSRHDLIDDQIDVVSRGLMGLTVADVTITSTIRFPRRSTMRSMRPWPAVGHPRSFRRSANLPIAMRIASTGPSCIAANAQPPIWGATKSRSCNLGCGCRSASTCASSPKEHRSRTFPQPFFRIAPTMSVRKC